MTTTPHHEVVLKLDSRDTQSVLTVATNVHNGMTTNAVHFPSPPVPMPVLDAQITDLQQKENVTKTKGHPGDAVTQRDASRDTVVSSLKANKGYVQQLCDASPGDAPKLAAMAGMELKEHGVHTKELVTLTALGDGSVKIEVNISLLFGATKKNHSIEYGQSLDGGHTYTTVESGPDASVTIHGLTRGAVVWFRVRGKIGGVWGPWSDGREVVVT